jgi:ribosomal protein S18 acetylase RimI-like enzyme
MSEAFIVRAASLSDYDGMRALLATVDELHRLNVPWLFRTPSAEPRSKEFFARLLSSEGSTVLVAEVRDELVGVATALLRSAPDFAVFVTQQWGVLDNIAVSESWRRQGVGTSLTRHAERWAESRGASWIELGVFEFNADARAFYRALGYAPISTKLRKSFDSAG